MPMLHDALGMDAQSVMLLTAMAQNAGITSTKSGTWIRSFFENSEPSLGDSKTAKEHNASLRRLGLLDDQDQVTWRKKDANGQIDWTGSITNMAGIVNEHVKALPLDERLGVLKQAWGERGGGFGALLGLDSFVDQLPIFSNKLKNFGNGGGAESALGEYSANSTLQKSREALRDFENLLVDLGEKILPPVNLALGGLDAALKDLPEDWRKSKEQWLNTWGAPAAKPGDKTDYPGLPDTGVVLQSYRVGGEASSAIDMLAQGVFKGLQLYAGGVPGVPDLPGVSHGGFTNAAYTTYDDAPGGTPASIRYGRQHARGGGYGNLIDGPVARFNAGGAFTSKAPEIMDRLGKDFGLTPDMSAKILGNLGHESGGFRQFSEIGGGSGIGWAQWTGPRNREFMAWSAANHLDPHSDEANYGFLKHELVGKYASAIRSLKNGGSLEDFERIFEGAGVKAYGSRHRYEAEALGAYMRRGEHAPVVTAPPKKVTPGSPASDGPQAIKVELTHRHEHAMHGKVFARETTRHIVTANLNPRSVGGADRYGQYQHPGADTVDPA